VLSREREREQESRQRRIAFFSFSRAPCLFSRAKIMKAPSLLLLLATLSSSTTHAWVVPSRSLVVRSPTCYRSRPLFSSPQEKKNKEEVDEEINEEIELSNISFDEAGKGLIEAEDAIRMEESGDFDTNPAVRNIVVQVS